IPAIVVLHRDHGLLFVADHDDLRGIVEQRGVGLADEEPAEGAGVPRCDERGSRRDGGNETTKCGSLHVRSRSSDARCKRRGGPRRVSPRCTIIRDETMSAIATTADAGETVRARPDGALAALILSGGGARAAYQVGVLRALADALPQD